MTKPVTRMTKKVRAALTAIEGVTINDSREVEVLVKSDSERADYDATEAAAEQASNVLGWGGYRTGYGSWILSRDYAPRSEWSTWVD